MMILTDQRLLFKRHIGSARQKLFRAKPSSNHENIFQRQQQSLPSPGVLRDRWMELYNEQNKTPEPLIIED
jgi:hypothetical protein